MIDNLHPLTSLTLSYFCSVSLMFGSSIPGSLSRREVRVGWGQGGRGGRSRKNSKRGQRNGDVKEKRAGSLFFLFFPSLLIFPWRCSLLMRQPQLSLHPLVQLHSASDSVSDQYIIKHVSSGHQVLLLESD